MLESSSSAEIARVSSLAPVKQALEHAPSDTLVLLDVDHVLIMPTDEYTLTRHPYREFLWTNLIKRVPTGEWKELYGITASRASWRLVEPAVQEVMALLKKKQMPTMALSSIYTGKFGAIDSIADWRVKQLKGLGLDFASLTPIKSNISANELMKDSLYGIPTLQSGVILTAQANKGTVLEYMLHKANYYPKTIIFVDDVLDNIESLENTCRTLNIKFYGFHYTAVEHMDVPSTDNHVEKLRFELLEREHKWLSYKEAELHLLLLSKAIKK